MSDDFLLEDDLDLDDEPQVEPAFESLDGWVAGYLSSVINRQIDPGAGRGLGWDPNWWQHPEVVARLTALWWAFEGARLRSAEDRSAMSGWWVDHCEPHLRVLLDGETGPMAGASKAGIWRGHGPLAYEPPPEGWSADDLADQLADRPEPVGENADELPAPAFSRLQDFVETYFCVVINRKIDPQPGHGLAWDARWWRHQEVVSRLTALWWAFEDARATADDPASMSNWWIRHCDPHLRVLLDGENGPMSHANTAGTWLGHGGLEMAAPPEGWTRPSYLTP
jgi:hypothetical protein